MLVGEQPGDKEDSPASRSSGPRVRCSTARWRGGSIAQGLRHQCGQHFKFVPRGNPATQKPNTPEIKACRHGTNGNWPRSNRLVVAMGATAAQSVWEKSRDQQNAAA